MQISPRTNEHENHLQHFWTRQIGDSKYNFVHVKVSRLGHPWIAVSRADTGELVRCSCRRDDCPFTA